MSQAKIDDFADKLNAILPVIIKEFSRRQTNELYKGHISLPQFLILEFLQREGASQMSILARAMHVTTAAMTGFIERLVRDGYVVRQSDPGDRRIIRIKLTPRGASLVLKINHQRRLMVIKIFGKISEEERQDYLRILAHIKEILSQEA
jgi:DNA-binding MarR family transcriptional regulator